jgi:acyl-CoA dehydrogenase
MTLPSTLQDAHLAHRGTELSKGDAADLEAYATFVREELEPTAFEVDRRARPYLAHHDLLGGDPEEVVLNPAYRSALGKVFASGLATGPVEGRHPWARSFLLGFLTTEIGSFCAATVTMATAFSLAKFGSEEIRARFLPPLLEGRGVKGGATWGTEAQGGSDLGSNRTRAVPQGGSRFLLNGEKYFCSNVGASCAVVTARPEGAPEGPRGIRLFFVPGRRENGSSNWRVRRLKEKLGTISVPTGEVSFQESEAYLLGLDEEGIIPTMEMLNVSRICNAVGSAGLLSRAVDLTADHLGQRYAFGKPLRDHPLAAQELARLEVEASAASVLAFDAAFGFDSVWKERPARSPTARLLRLATHAAKFVTAEQAVRGTVAAMELFGGPGYLEEFPVAKMLRDAVVLPIWEGGANRQALDAAEISARSRPEAVWIEAARQKLDGKPSDRVRAFLERRIAAADRPADHEPGARSRLLALAELRQMTLLLSSAEVRRKSEGPDRTRARALPELMACLRDGAPGESPTPGMVEDVLARR